MHPVNESSPTRRTSRFEDPLTSDSRSLDRSLLYPTRGMSSALTRVGAGTVDDPMDVSDDSDGPSKTMDPRVSREVDQRTGERRIMVFEPKNNTYLTPDPSPEPPALCKNTTNHPSNQSTVASSPNPDPVDVEMDAINTNDDDDDTFVDLPDLEEVSDTSNNEEDSPDKSTTDPSTCATSISKSSPVPELRSQEAVVDEDTGDKDPNIQWAHAEHIRSTDNM